MPIKRKQGESKDDFMSRCISVEINAGKQTDQAAAICYAAWDEKQLKAIKNIRRKMRMAKVSIDYDGTLSTDAGKELAKRLLNEGNDVYIISARGDKERMLGVAADLGIPSSRVYATGSNKAKIEKIKELGIKKHWDNNNDVINQLPKIGQDFLQFEKIRVVSESSNVERMMWIRDDENPNIGNLVVRFNDGSTYTYYKVDEATFNDVSEGNAQPKTTGENDYGSWREGVGPSVGAAVHKYLIDKFNYTKGGTFR